MGDGVSPWHRQPAWAVGVGGGDEGAHAVFFERAAHCEGCPVPGIVRANGCPNLRLEARVGRRFGILKKVQVDAFCIEYLCEVDEPKVGCGHCHEFARGG